MGIERHVSVTGFFHEVLTDALDRQHVEVSESTEYYLVGLLGEFTKARITDEPLSIMLVGGEEQAPADRVKKLKEVGDTSLYVTGFFASSLDKKLVDPDYYIGLGEAAYTELAHRLRTASSIAGVYEELASKFPRFVDVLAEVRAQVSFVGSDVVELYQEWLRTRSEWIERRLHSMGVLVSGPAKDGKDLLQ